MNAKYTEGVDYRAHPTPRGIELQVPVGAYWERICYLTDAQYAGVTYEYWEDTADGAPDGPPCGWDRDGAIEKGWVEE